MSIPRAPPTKAAGTGHLCQQADCKQHQLWDAKHTEAKGLQHLLAQAGQHFSDPPAPAQQIAKPSPGPNTCPTTEAAAGRAAFRQDWIPLFCVGSDQEAFAWEKQGCLWSSTGEREGEANACGCCCCGRDVSTSERDLLVSPRGLEGKQKLWLKISSGDSCAFTLPSLTSFRPTAVSCFGGVGRLSGKVTRGRIRFVLLTQTVSFPYPLPPARCPHCLSPASPCVHPGVNSAIQFRKMIQLKSLARKKKKFPTRI